MSAAPADGHRRRILVLAPFPPRLDGAHGGSRAIGQLLFHLAERHTIALLCLRGADEPPVDEALRERCELVEEIPRTWSGRNAVALRRLRLAAGLLRGSPMWATRFSSRAFSRRAAELARTWRPDLVQIEYHIMAQYAVGLDRDVPRLLVVYEPGALAAREAEALTRGLRALVRRLDRLAWERFERRTGALVDGLITLTQRDSRELAGLLPADRMWTIPLGAVLADRPLSSLGSQPPRVLFFGNFLHPPNVEAARTLVTDIMPRVWQDAPGTALDLVGDSAPPDIRRSADERITVTGLVPDVTPFLDSAAVVVLPLRSGGGMRVKLLESLAAGKCVVCSPLATEGLDVRDGVEVIVAGNSEDTATAILELIRDPELRLRIGRDARFWAERHLRWGDRIAAFESVYDALLRGTGGGASGVTGDRSAS